MNVPVTQQGHVRLDEIHLLLGKIPQEEFELRDRLRQHRTIASHRVLSAKTGLARALLWAVCDVATLNLFAGHQDETLRELVGLSRRLLLTAEQAERLGEVVNGLG